MATYVAAGTPAATTATLPAGTAVGDYVCVCAYRGANATLPTLPANWIVATQLASNPAHLVAYREYDGVWTMPTFTSAQRCVSFTVRPASGMDCKPGAVRSDAFNATNVSWPALTLQVTDGSSVVVRGVCHTRNDNAFPVPTGHTQIDNNGTQPGYGTFRKNSSTDAAAATSAISRSTTYTTFTVEVRDVPPPKTGTAAVTHSWIPTATGTKPVVVSASLNTLVDSFAATVDKTTKWPDTSLGVVWDQGRAKIPCTTAYQALQTRLFSGTAYDLTGAGLFAKVTVPAFGTGTRQTAMSLHMQGPTPEDNKVRLMVTGSTLAFIRVIGGTQTDVKSAAYSATSHAWWRLRESAGTIYADTSPDGTTWTNFATTTVTWDISHVAAVFLSGYFGTETAADVFIDSVNILEKYGTAAVTHDWTLTATGTKPVVPPKEGTAVVSHDWTSTATGATPIQTIPTTGLAGWWDADDAVTITQTANNVSQWNDKSPKGMHVTQPTGSRQPITNTNTMNGRNVLRFDGVQQFLFRPTPVQMVNAATGEWSAFAAVRTSSISGVRDVIDQDSGSGNRIVQFLRNNNALVQTVAFNTGGIAQVDSTSVLVVANTPYCCSAVRTASTVEVWVNGSSDGPFATTGTANNASNYAIAIGGSRGGTAAGFQWWQGDIAEVIVYSRAVTTAERQQVESYLNTKWLGEVEPPKTGTAIASWSESTIAAGNRTPVSQATTVLTWALTGAGTRTSKGNTTAAHTWVTASAGKRTPKATAVPAAWTETIASTGKRSPASSAAVTHTWTPTAAGVKPVVGVNQGNAAASWSITSSAKGEKGRESWATVNHSWTLLAQGVKPLVGVSQGASLAVWKMATQGGSPIGVSGGDITDVGVYRVHTFTTSGTLTYSGTPIQVDALVVAGGGSGGRPGATSTSSGGGGAGAVLTGTFTISASQPITVGAGGTSPAAASRNGTNGSDSSFGSLVALGGGGGGGTSTTPGGGSGGGAYNNPTGNGAVAAGTGTTGGNDGGLGNDGTAPVANRRGGGGGGAGAVGTSGRGGAAPHGGAGISNDYSGVATFYGGGGGGGASQAPLGNGGVGGGGAGAAGTVPAAAIPNTGGGGGGVYGTAVRAGDGGSGVVIVRYPLGDPNGGWAIGKVTPKANATVSASWVQTATGQKILSGTVATTYTMATAAQGKKTPKATAATTYTETLTVTGKKVTKGQAAATHAWTTVAQGVKPVIGVNQGSALVTTSWTPTAGGKRVPKSSAAVVHAWTPTATGKKVQRGSAAVIHLWQPGVTGKRLPKSVATASHTWVSVITGRRPAGGTSSLGYSFSSTAVGTSDLGIGQITWNGKAVLEMQYGDQPVTDWLMVPA